MAITTGTSCFSTNVNKPAIAKEDKLYKPSAKKFLTKYNLVNSSVQRSLPALFEKELVYLEQDAMGSYYRVYDCFLARWLERN